MKRPMAVTLLLFFCASLALAAEPRDPSRYSRVLLPFHTSVVTANGAWSVTWFVRNDGDTAADAFPLAFNCGLPPPPELRDFAFIVPAPAVAAHSTLSCLGGDVGPSLVVPAYLPVLTDGAGAFLYIEKSSRLAASGSLQWVSRDAQPRATLLRGIPESSFLSRTGSIFPVPSVQGTRYDLRIYALPETVTSTRVNIRVFEMQPVSFEPAENLVGSATVDLRIPSASVAPCANPCDIPAVAVAPAVAQLFDFIHPAGGSFFASPFRVEITPESGDVRWWAVVSILDNDTREVRLVQPSM